MVKKDWRQFDSEEILKGLLYSMTPNKLMTDNRFRHCKSVRDYSIRVLDEIYTKSFPFTDWSKMAEDRKILFSHAALLHDCMKGAANADTGTDHGKLAGKVIESIFGRTALPISASYYDMIIEAVNEHSNKIESLKNSSNVFLIALIFGDMLDHVTPDYEKMMHMYAEEMHINVDGYIDKKRYKINEALKAVEENPMNGNEIKQCVLKIIKEDNLKI